jgi:hypothetical protein
MWILATGQKYCPFMSLLSTSGLADTAALTLSWEARPRLNKRLIMLTRIRCRYGGKVSILVCDVIIFPCTEEAENGSPLN